MKQTFEVGQVWEYETRTDEKESELYIAHIDGIEDGTEIFHLFVDRIVIRTPVGNVIQKNLPHTPITRRALEASVTKLIYQGNDVPDISTGYALWASDENAGVFDITVREIVDAIENTAGSQVQSHASEKTPLFLRDQNLGGELFEFRDGDKIIEARYSKLGTLTDIAVNGQGIDAPRRPDSGPINNSTSDFRFYDIQYQLRYELPLTERARCTLYKNGEPVGRQQIVHTPNEAGQMTSAKYWLYVLGIALTPLFALYLIVSFDALEPVVYPLLAIALAISTVLFIRLVTLRRGNVRASTVMIDDSKTS